MRSSSSRLAALAAGLACLLEASCGPDAAPDYQATELAPYPNPVHETAPALYEQQPRRENPRALALSIDGATLFVALQGSPDEPGREVLAMDVGTGRVVSRWEVGPSPTGLAVHPDGRFLVATTRFADALAVIDLREGAVRHLRSDFYQHTPAFSPDGRRLYVSNHRWDSIQVFDVDLDGSDFRLREVSVPDGEHGVPAGSNPRDVIVSSDGARVYTGSMQGLTVSMIDTSTLREIDADDDPESTDIDAPPGISRRNIRSPANGLALAGGMLYVATISDSSHHPALGGPDTNHDGLPGDGTPNFGFQDLQNELALLDAGTLRPVVRYTSDTICCVDFRDVSPDNPELGSLMPPRETWIVGGALPEQVAFAVVGEEPSLVVIYSGSNEVQRFTVREDGTLAPGPRVETGYNPSALVIDDARDRAYIANRLGETVQAVDLATMEVEATWIAGDVSGGEFPATDAEIGELFFFSGAGFSLDGDQTCNHCHRERGNIGKAFSMPLLSDFRGSRLNPPSRGLADTRPWFLEGAMDENNFFPVINEFARTENFCCFGTEDPAACAADPPDECDERVDGRRFPTRDAFFMDAATRVVGRNQSFGGVVPTRIDYLGLTRLLGAFLLQEPALLPNPNLENGADVERGRAIFLSPVTGCATCHPAPAFAVSFESNPQEMPTLFGPLVTPTLDEAGVDLDFVNNGFLQIFTMSRQDENGIRFNPPMLQGTWDRGPAFLHDGRARNLRETLCTPGHPALREGERGFNEFYGIPDTHGGTSHLSAGDVEDLIAFLLTL